MKWANQKDLLISLEKRVEGHIQEGIHTFQNLSEQELMMPALNGGWSITQCLEHLNTYGYFYLPRIKSSLEKRGNSTPPRHPFKSSWIGNYFVRIMEPETGKKKHKAFAKHVPPTGLNAHAVVAEFIRQQEELLVDLELAQKVDLHAICIPVSFSKLIRLNLGDLFRFLVAHNERHVLQASILIPKAGGNLKGAV